MMETESKELCHLSCDECGLVDHGPNARAISRDVNRTATT
jgi:hypothetical protein